MHPSQSHSSVGSIYLLPYIVLLVSLILTFVTRFVADVDLPLGCYLRILPSQDGSLEYVMRSMLFSQSPPSFCFSPIGSDEMIDAVRALVSAWDACMLVGQLIYDEGFMSGVNICWAPGCFG